MQRTETTIREGMSKKRKFFAWLVDPDKSSPQKVVNNLHDCKGHLPDFVFIGGSLLLENHIADFIREIKSITHIPVILFPGSIHQVCAEADALLFLSLISGRNPDFLIGRHVEVACQLRNSGLEVLPTGYILVDSGVQTTASYISGTIPIPHNKPDIALSTALAGELLGLRFIFLDAGSGASMPVSSEMIQSVKKNITLPLIVGGGIRTPELMHSAFNAGADIVVVGNCLEEHPEIMIEFSKTRDSF